MNSTSPTVLITGSGGFIGSRLVCHFRESGWKTYGLGHSDSTDPESYSCDLSQPLPDKLVNLIQDVDVVVHAAARTAPCGPREQFQANNIDATENLINACRNAGHPALIFLSTPQVFYQPRDQFEINEQTPWTDPPSNLYAWSKQCAERLVQEYEGRWVILRPRAVFGVGDRVTFPRILRAAKAKKFPLIKRPDGPLIVELLSIDNLIEFVFQAANNPMIAGDFNLTDNQELDLHQLLADVFRRLEIPQPNWHLTIDSAMRLAKIVETGYRWFVPWIEPPITRYSVNAFAWSKTFDVSKMIEVFGQPKWTTEQSIDRFVKWVKTENPYRL